MFTKSCYDQWYMWKNMSKSWKENYMKLLWTHREPSACIAERANNHILKLKPKSWKPTSKITKTTKPAFKVIEKSDPVAQKEPLYPSLCQLPFSKSNLFGFYFVKYETLHNNQTISTGIHQKFSRSQKNQWITSIHQHGISVKLLKLRTERDQLLWPSNRSWKGGREREGEWEREKESLARGTQKKERESREAESVKTGERGEKRRPSKVFYKVKNFVFKMFFLFFLFYFYFYNIEFYLTANIQPDREGEKSG